MKRVLIFVDWYLPGYKAGGQISSCANIVLALQDRMEIFIITRDRDLDDTAAYQGITANTWMPVQDATINYLSPGKENFTIFKKLINEIVPDTIYFNSMFSYRFTLLPLLAIKMSKYKNKLVLAPRGMLQAGALQFKSLKKNLVLSVLYYSGIFKNVLFHATDEIEAKDIKKNIKGIPHIQLVYDFPAMKQDLFTGMEKKPGYLNCLFISRIVGKKNLLYLLELMASTKKNISLTIIGPVEDKIYWEVCRQQIKNLPPACNVVYNGSIPNNMLPEVYKQHHLFVLPTLGENFGHVIFDAFINGRPVLISDQTPWKNLADKKAGYDINLADKEKFFETLEYFADLDKAGMDDWCKNAWVYGKNHIEGAGVLKKQYQSLFS